MSIIENPSTTFGAVRTVGEPTAGMFRTDGYVGTSVPKKDSRELVTGKARFTSDIKLPGLVWGRLLRSQHAHARITSIDTSKAKALPGVLDVVTAADLVATGIKNQYQWNAIPDMHLICDKAHFVGDVIGAVVAETEQLADDALQLIEVEYEVLPHVLDAEEALRDDAPVIHENVPGVDGNVLGRHRVKVGDMDKAMAEADVVIKRRFRTAKQQATPMESHQAQAQFDDDSGRLTVWSSTQYVHGLQAQIAAAVGLPISQVRVIKPFVGGGFGHKIGMHSHEGMAAIFAMRIGRPVRIAMSREEEYFTASRNGTICDVELALKKDGTLLGWKERIIADPGGHSNYGMAFLVLTTSLRPGPYNWQALDMEAVAAYTNKCPNSAFRAFGNPQATYVRESMLSIAAKEIGMDPWELRVKNAIRQEQLPMTTMNGLKLETLAIQDCLREAADVVNYKEIQQNKPKWRGVGVASTLHWSSCRWDSDLDADSGATIVQMMMDGSCKVFTDAADSGQGHTTIFAQIVADELGIPVDRVDVIMADTDKVPFGLGTWGSRSAVIQGTSTKRAAANVRGQLFNVAAHMLEASVDDLLIRDSKISVAGSPDRFVNVADVAIAMHLSKSKLPPGMEAGNIVGSATYDTPTELPSDHPDGIGHISVNYQASTHIAVVDVDPETGDIDIVDYGMSDDVGRLLNPALVKGQLLGGFAHGLGFAWGEDEEFGEDGSPLNFDFTGYQIPTFTDVPYFTNDQMRVVQTYDPAVPDGQKGAGEVGLVCPAPAIAAAVADAIGVAITEMPMTPAKILKAIRGRAAAAGAPAA
jgi:CO/xanthine dehydrogenase Mo-binding subunit